MPDPITIAISLLESRELPAFSADKLDEVCAAFQPAAGCLLGQAWRSAPEADFTPGYVRVGWRRDLLLVFAELSDTDIFTRATMHNQRMWELGDAFEIFLQSEDSANYVEFHIAPNNQRLQLSFPDTATLRRAQAANAFEDYLLPDGTFRSRVWTQPKNWKWFIYTEIPASSVCRVATSLAERRWRFSFSRCDYIRRRQAPILSSTSPHSVPDFHRREEWRTLCFVSAVKPLIQEYETAQ